MRSVTCDSCDPFQAASSRSSTDTPDAVTAPALVFAHYGVLLAIRTSSRRPPVKRCCRSCVRANGRRRRRGFGTSSPYPTPLAPLENRWCAARPLRHGAWTCWRIGLRFIGRSRQRSAERDRPARGARTPAPSPGCNLRKRCAFFQTRISAADHASVKVIAPRRGHREGDGCPCSSTPTWTAAPSRSMRIYCARGRMENIIKEHKAAPRATDGKPSSGCSCMPAPIGCCIGRQAAPGARRVRPRRSRRCAGRSWIAVRIEELRSRTRLALGLPLSTLIAMSGCMCRDPRGLARRNDPQTHQPSSQVAQPASRTAVNAADARLDQVMDRRE